MNGYLKIEGIEGEARHAGFEGQIEVEAFSHLIVQPSAGAMTSIGGGPGARAEHDSFNFTKKLDKATPKLAQACCSGRTYPQVTLTLNRASGDTPIPYMVYTLKNVFVQAVRPSGVMNQTDGSFPMEEVSLKYGTIVWKYTQQMPDGSPGGSVEVGWNCESNTGIG